MEIKNRLIVRKWGEKINSSELIKVVPFFILIIKEGENIGTPKNSYKFIRYSWYWSIL